MSLESTLSPSIFDKTTLVLVEPKYSGNLGAVARAMKNMGFSRLSLVAPRAEINDEARWMAVGADDILDAARRYDTLADALAGAPLVVGTTSRLGRWQMYSIPPAEMVQILSGCWARRDLALVFGPEDRGLRRSEVGRCQWIVTIPTDPGWPSINISHAVMVLCYELRRAVGEEGASDERAEVGEVEDLLAHTERTLSSIGFLIPDDPRRMMLKVQRVVGRADLTDREVRSLHALLRHIEGLVRS